MKSISRRSIDKMLWSSLLPNTQHGIIFRNGSYGMYRFELFNIICILLISYLRPSKQSISWRSTWARLARRSHGSPFLTHSHALECPICNPETKLLPRAQPVCSSEEQWARTGNSGPQHPSSRTDVLPRPDTWRMTIRTAHSYLNDSKWWDFVVTNKRKESVFSRTQKYQNFKIGLSIPKNRFRSTSRILQRCVL